MFKRLPLLATLAVVLGALASLMAQHPTQACGGFFCQNSPVDQNAERIIFAKNHDGTMSTYIQIQYTGSAAEFSWILPLPEPIGPEDIEVPEDAMAAFTELQNPETTTLAVLARRTDGQVDDTVAVEVAQGRDRLAEAVVRRERAE